MAPVTRARAAFQRWQRLRLPSELVHQVLSDLVGEHLHLLFTKSEPAWDMIGTMLGVSFQYRSVTAALLRKALSSGGPEGYSDDHSEVVLASTLDRIRRVRRLCQKSRHAPDEYLQSLPDLMVRESDIWSVPLFRIYLGLSGGEALLFYAAALDDINVMLDPAIKIFSVFGNVLAFRKSVRSRELTSRGCYAVAVVEQRFLICSYLHLLSRIYTLAQMEIEFLRLPRGPETEPTFKFEECLSKLWPALDEERGQWLELLEMVDTPLNPLTLTRQLTSLTKIGQTLKELLATHPELQKRAPHFEALLDAPNRIQKTWDVGGTVPFTQQILALTP
ncbi:hypothetical protein SISNIDRAFT_3447 [Sistotremastrum niveocremeum HHB9708]|uniref:Uncharacterized protein n=1 Tax=Sistotremastrum niveocremeum HHB9708 TaxID=1314777 RepID=A0A165AF31_9AGAM|nr:hypothetical protein SISNIDRAFT_3447 [Sistotremastrum niveocremeum HHB9708]